MPQDRNLRTNINILIRMSLHCIVAIWDSILQIQHGKNNTSIPLLKLHHQHIPKNHRRLAYKLQAHLEVETCGTAHVRVRVRVRV
jgi:hypothetical protein